MAKNQKNAVLLGRMAASSALFLLMLGAGSLTAHAAGYDLYIGSTQVTDANAGDILGDGTASYDAATKTLTLNGVQIGADNYYAEGYSEDWPEDRYSLYAGAGMVEHLVINGNNSFEAAMADVVYTFEAKKTEGLLPADANNDGKIDINDADVTAQAGRNGIYLYAPKYPNYLVISGSGTLTSRAVTPTTPDKSRAYDYADFYKVGFTVVPPDETVYAGSAMIVGGENGQFSIGEAEFSNYQDAPKACTGPKLVLTGLDVGADFSNCSGFHMRGGTIIAEATNTEYGIGVFLANDNFFDAGTVAAKGKYSEAEDDGGAFSYGGRNILTNPGGKKYGMKLVYPETTESGMPDRLDSITGWAVVGMTADDYKASTDAVLQELNFDPSGGGTDPGTDPTNPDTPGTGEGNSYHTDTVPDPGVEIDVQGYTKAATVYSVDVEWGVMTFRYEKSSWDAENHVAKPGAGWVVYDNVNDKVLGKVQNAINRITVTNHSNAEVYATLSYAGNDGYTDIGGGFTKSADDAETVFTEAAASAPAYLTLATADNDKGGEGIGQETVGTAYFMPEGIGTTDGTVNDISQWTKIGKITVSLLTEAP